MSLLFTAEDDGLAALARCRPGDVLAVQGPLGQGFRVEPNSRHLLLLADGIGVAALAPLAAWAVGRGLEVTLLAGSATASVLLPAALLPAEVEYRLATSDGSLGHHGSPLELLAPSGEDNLLLWADQVFAVGPVALYLGLRRPSPASAPAPLAVSARLWCRDG